MRWKTRSKKRELDQHNLTETNRGLLFSSYKHVKIRVFPVKSSKVSSETHKFFTQTFGGDASVQTVRKWIKRWKKNGDELVVATNRPKTYNCKRKRLSDQISVEFQKGKSCNGVAFEQFTDGGQHASVSKTTAFRARKDLNLKPAAAKRRRIVTFTPHHAKAAKTVCEGNLVMERELKEAGRSWSMCFVFEDEKGWKGTLYNGQIIWVPAGEEATANIQQDCNR